MGAAEQQARPSIDSIFSALDVVNLGVTSLAWLAHEAEYLNDDITFMWIQNEVQFRPGVEQQAYNEEYKRLWPEHAKVRGYGKQQEQAQ